VSGYARLLRDNPGFARLWLAQVISLLGDWFDTIVLSALVSRYSNGSGLAVSGFLLARLLPPLVISPFAGVLVDRFNRKHLLILSDLLRVVVVLGFLLASKPSLLWLIYLLTLCQFTLSGIFEPARSAIVPSLVPSKNLVSANTLSSVTWSVMLAAGAVAGILVAGVFGTAIALCIDSTSFALSALLITGIRPRLETDTGEKPKKPVNERTFRDGLRYLGKHSDLAMTLLVKLGQSLGNVDALLIIYATKVYVIGENGTTSLGILYGSFGVGAVLGPLALNRFNDGTIRVMRRLIAIGYLWIVLGWIVMGSALSIWIVALAIVIRGMGGSCNWTYSSVIIQKITPNEYLGRMFSLDGAGFQFASIVSILVTGMLVDALGADKVRQIMLLMAGVGMVPLVLWIMGTLRLERQPPMPAPIGD
jgi:MFS family permease